RMIASISGYFPGRYRPVTGKRLVHQLAAISQLPRCGTSSRTPSPDSRASFSSSSPITRRTFERYTSPGRVQTPQGARADWLRAAFARAAKERWEVTDESMLLERCGRPVRMVEGDAGNVKVTVPSDWALLRARP
ncbi:MAG: 2-C-methyl-D-erythritol 4-phosphate cytidylyltransferase, partial [Candidatus Brocadiae bacterium]|nr:2-C-methyl-D-erythritol 4-phosphate cytidylyltransferase [Candidatus Brocadiia bacterium]